MFTPRTASNTEAAVQENPSAVTSTLESLKDGVAHLRQAAQAAPVALSQAAEQAAGQVQNMARHSLDRAHDLSDTVREKAHRANDRTIGYIQDEPRKAVLMAAVVGAGVALLVRALTAHR